MMFPRLRTWRDRNLVLVTIDDACGGDLWYHIYYQGRKLTPYIGTLFPHQVVKKLMEHNKNVIVEYV